MAETWRLAASGSGAALIQKLRTKRHGGGGKHCCFACRNKTGIATVTIILLAKPWAGSSKGVRRAAAVIR